MSAETTDPDTEQNRSEKICVGTESGSGSKTDPGTQSGLIAWVGGREDPRPAALSSRAIPGVCQLVCTEEARPRRDSSSAQLIRRSDTPQTAATRLLGNRVMVCTSFLQSPVFPIRRAASCGGNNTDKFYSNLLSVWRIAWTIPDLQPSLGDCHSVTPGQNEAELSEEPEKADRPLHRCCTALQSCRYCRRRCC
jgi:hypothetical protein